MASGNLGSTRIVSGTINTYQTIYTVPAGKTATISVNFCNMNGAPARVRLAVTAAANAVAAGEFFDFDFPVDAIDSYERTAMVVSANKNVTVYSDSANVDINVYGFEE